jgi:hypothetical protein
MKKSNTALYIISLILFISGSLLLAIAGIDELGLTLVFVVGVYVLAILLRLGSIKELAKWWDVLFLILFGIFMVGVSKLFHPLVYIWVSYNQTYLSIITILLAVTSFLQLIRLAKDFKIYRSIFILLLIAILIHPFVLNIYTNSINLNDLPPNSRIYIYSSDDYREKIIEVAFNDASIVFKEEENKSGTKQYEMLAQKIAFEYLRKNPNPDEEYINRLKEVLSLEHHNWFANQTIDELKRKYNLSN